MRGSLPGARRAPRAPLYPRLAEGTGGADRPGPSTRSASFRTRPPGGSRQSVPVQLDKLWGDIRDELRRDTPDFKFHIWIDPLELAGVDGKTLYVRAPEHIRTSVAERYLPLLRRVAARRFDSHAVVEIVGPDWSPPTPQDAPRPAAPGAARERLNPKYSFD